MDRQLVVTVHGNTVGKIIVKTFSLLNLRPKVRRKKISARFAAIFGRLPLGLGYQENPTRDYFGYILPGTLMSLYREVPNPGTVSGAELTKKKTERTKKHPEKKLGTLPLASEDRYSWRS